ncbi:putative short-chain dehydrogenase reductase family protein [Rosellinia necatrix]|uniref:Putative short-chain dehydrogenase reductase family protein n=1 Tax=Rosellinia necatrix TaxID=77044 RepID=A0A1S8A5S6_ROSNE|nr:putative short-chain dehydrogenase reductase family protein [Rosellinia necatrix]
MMLDLDRYDSCTGFMDELKHALPGAASLDVVVLNAGLVNSEYEKSLEGWEQTIQVNTISTTLVGLLLLEWMREGREHRSSPAHLVFVTSRDHIYTDVGALAELSKKEGGILRQVCSEENWPGHAEMEPNYANSKLFAMYTIDEISKLARAPDGEPLVIVNSLCPGLVRTDIGRSVATRSRLTRLVVYIHLAIFGKTPDHGARICTTVALKPKENHGEFFNYWLSPSLYSRYAQFNIRLAFRLE